MDNALDYTIIARLSCITGIMAGLFLGLVYQRRRAALGHRLDT